MSFQGHCFFDNAPLGALSKTDLVFLTPSLTCSTIQIVPLTRASHRISIAFNNISFLFNYYISIFLSYPIYNKNANQ